MPSRNSAACAALLILTLGACSKQATPPPAPATANDKAEPAEGAPRIAISPDGIHVQYHVYGQGEPALVFIHGWSCDSNYWREQVGAFKRKYTVVTVDLAGHGGTDANRADWGMERFGQDVATALAAVPNRQFILVGHSMGGPVAIEAARLLKSRVIGIIGVDTFKTIGAPLPTAAQLEAVIKPFEANFIGQTRNMVAAHFFALLFLCVLASGLHAQTPISGVVNTYTPIVWVGGCHVDVASTEGLAAGDRVLVIQMTGASIETSNTPAFGSIVRKGEAGSYELATIAAISGNRIALTRSFGRNVSGSVRRRSDSV
jgi:pimeloyl-ACP methyl ester carboxylesterase